MEPVCSPEIAELIDQLERAEHCEAYARKCRAEGYDPADVMHCGFEWGGVDCYRCETQPECDLWLREFEDMNEAAFETVWNEYHTVRDSLRKALATEPDNQIIWRLLARVLLDIDIHPNKMETDPAELYWEAQYWYLRLYYTAGDAKYFEQAKLIEGFRHATVRLVDGDAELGEST